MTLEDAVQQVFLEGTAFEPSKVKAVLVDLVDVARLEALIASALEQRQEDQLTFAL